MSNAPTLIRIMDSVTALIAAGLWFWSAAGHLPAPAVARVGPVIPSDPFYGALLQSALLNRWAALFTGLSVALGAVEHVMPGSRRRL